MIEEPNCNDFTFRLEQVDDFAIFGCKDFAVSTHQVKAKASSARDTKALDQACRDHENYTEESTERYFHVATEPDDSSDYTNTNGTTVKFYEYQDDLKHLPLEDIDEKIDIIISEYLNSNSLLNTELLIEFKKALLYTFIDIIVNKVHAKNQNSQLTQFQAATETTITFKKLEGILAREVEDSNDQQLILERFRRNLLEELDNIIDNYDEGGDPCISELLQCRNGLSMLCYQQLVKLYYSFNLKKSAVEPNGVGGDINSYINILDTISNLVTNNELPHYLSQSKLTFLPSNFTWPRNRSDSALRNIFENLKNNNNLANVIFEYDNLVLDIESGETHLDTPRNISERFTHNNEGMNDPEFVEAHSTLEHITKPRIRFISIDQAKEELK